MQAGSPEILTSQILGQTQYVCVTRAVEPQPRDFLNGVSRSLEFGFRFHRRSLWGKRVVQTVQWILVVNGPNHSGAGAKNVGAWSLKFELRLYSPGCLSIRTRALNTHANTKYAVSLQERNFPTPLRHTENHKFYENGQHYFAVLHFTHQNVLSISTPID